MILLSVFLVKCTHTFVLSDGYSALQLASRPQIIAALRAAGAHEGKPEDAAGAHEGQPEDGENLNVDQDDESADDD